MHMKNYDIRITDGYSTEYCRGYAEGYGPMDATENAVASGTVYVNNQPPEIPVQVIAINMATGLAFKFEMAQAI